MSRVSRSVLCTATRTSEAALSGSSPTRPPASSPSEPRIEVSGVRSSWLTTERNSSFMRSTSRRWVTSRKTTTAPRTSASSSRGAAVISTGNEVPSART